jgi:RHS repeat-associated protein
MIATLQHSDSLNGCGNTDTYHYTPPPPTSSTVSPFPRPQASMTRWGGVQARNGDTFGYNHRSEVTSAAIGTDAYGYAFDGIGNRMAASLNGVNTVYTANSLNQYTSVSAPSAPPRGPQYDADGNMLSDGVFDCGWDAENRLVSVFSNGVATVQNLYDHRHRRFRKEIPDAVHSYVWDGWNLAAETVSNKLTGAVCTDLYTRGPDLSGTLQGAGGVGGLLAVTRVSASGTQTFFPACDANGNVTEHINDSGATVAHREYGPFGETIRATGPMADTFNFWFSTKYLDHETGFYYYGYRFYSSPLGRFITRDPIGKDGGLNLYGFVGNDPVNKTDWLGLTGRIEVSHWQKDPQSSSRRSWLVGVLCYPPDDWKSKKTECLPCKKVVWTQKWSRPFVLLGRIETHSAWTTDWDDSSSHKFGERWIAGGKSQRASFYASPGLRTIKGVGMLYTAFHFEFVSIAKCIEGNDAGDSYATFKWHVNWGRATDQIEAAYEMED